MSHTTSRIEALQSLGEFIRTKPTELQEISTVAGQHNGWFDEKNCWDSLHAIESKFLQSDLLHQFVQAYNLEENKMPKTVALILAGNIPLVGFHDVLCTYLSGNIAQIKLSSKDNILTKAILMKLKSIAPNFANQIQIKDEESLQNFDAVIATGSNNSSRYFEEYFGKYPNIIRKNRTSLGLLTGDESTEQLHQLGLDIFTHYGLGCRNVSFLFVPKEYNFDPLLQEMNKFDWPIQNQKYLNNYDYNLSLLLINKVKHHSTPNLLLVENESLHSRIATIHFSYYESADEINNYIIEHQDELQLIAGQDFIPFGVAQQPNLNDFADKVDTMEFLTSL